VWDATGANATAGQNSNVMLNMSMGLAGGMATGLANSMPYQTMLNALSSSTDEDERMKIWI